MPKIAKELSALEVGRLTVSGFHAVGGVPGLHLQVSAQGARSWILRVKIGAHRRDMGFYQQLKLRDGLGARALQFAMLTAARSGEVRGATWSEIDLDKAVWIVPAGRMKAGREHRVPLSAEAATLLRQLPRLEGTDLVFPAPRGQQLSDMSLSAVMRRMVLISTEF